MNVKVMAALFGIAVLSGCASSKTSPERHAFYFVSHQSSFTGGNYTSSVQKNYHLNVAQFRELTVRKGGLRLKPVNTSKAFAIS